ncbi:hypothetical protein DH2020_046337 [Rehmannia glutinosa]|uniref:Protein kinase domain-containing protein n=1 Tax=Rehmannia glutinosa TaxID=99300 RepID=A0ABR0UBJ9_REHGL
MTTLVEPSEGYKGKHGFEMWHRFFELDKKYVPIKLIGRVSYGVVCSSINKKTNEKVAIKKIMDVFENRVTAIRTLREMTLLRCIKHENVVELKEVMMPNNWREPAVAMERSMMKYVVTRWYRAPEILVSCDNYGPAVDMWSVGCILAEILGRKPIFQGTSSLHQLKLIVTVLGSQSEAHLKFIDKQKAKMFVQSLISQGIDFCRLYPKADPLAIDLLGKLVVFDPFKRITATQRLCVILTSRVCMIRVAVLRPNVVWRVM